MFFQFFIICKRTNNANNATHYVKLGKKRRKSSKRNYYIISPRVIIKAIIIIPLSLSLCPLPPSKSLYTFHISLSCSLSSFFVFLCISLFLMLFLSLSPSVSLSLLLSLSLCLSECKKYLDHMRDTTCLLNVGHAPNNFQVQFRSRPLWCTGHSHATRHLTAPQGACAWTSAGRSAFIH